MSAATTRNSPRPRKTVLVHITVLVGLWGSMFLWVEVALDAFTPIQITFARCFLGALVLAAILRWRREPLPPRRLWGHLAVAAIFTNVIPFGLFAIGQQTVDSGVTGVLNATTPLWTLLIGVTVGAERMTHRAQLAGLNVGFAGIMVIFAPWTQQGLLSWGALAIIGGAVSYAFAFVHMGRFLVSRGSSPIALAGVQLGLAAAMCSVFVASEQTAPAFSPHALTALLILGVFGTGVTLALFVALVANEGPTRAATVSYLLPVVALALGAIVLNEPLNGRIIAGAAVVVLGVVLTDNNRLRSNATARPMEVRVRYNRCPGDNGTVDHGHGRPPDSRGYIEVVVRVLVRCSRGSRRYRRFSSRRH